LFGFRRVICADAEFGTDPHTSRPRPICFVFTVLPDHQNHRLWLLGQTRMPKLPFRLNDPENVLVVYNAAAEISVLDVLQEPFGHVIDLFAEYRAITNGIRASHEKTRLIEALTHYGLFHIDVEEKEYWQDMAGRYNLAELEANREGMLDYCHHSDVDGLVALVEHSRMQADLAKFHRDEILFRGRSMAARARVIGVPSGGNASLVRAIGKHRLAARLAITRQAQARHQWGGVCADGVWRPIFDETGGWHQEPYEKWVSALQIRLPRTKKNKQITSKIEVLENYEVKHPALAPLRRTVHFRNLLNNFDVQVNGAGYIHWFANEFGSITGRDQPSSARGLFNLPSMFRQFAAPMEGYSLAYFDVHAEEPWIGYRLSGDQAMREAYHKDIYLQSLFKAGQVSPNDDPETLKTARNKKGKQLVLATNYGQSSYGFAVAARYRQRRCQAQADILHSAGLAVFDQKATQCPQHDEFSIAGGGCRLHAGRADRRDRGGPKGLLPCA
jgi:hypothetical protein